MPLPAITVRAFELISLAAACAGPDRRWHFRRSKRGAAAIVAMTTAGAIAALLGGCSNQSASPNKGGAWTSDGGALPGAGAGRSATGTPSFRQVADSMMPHLGAGNWIVIADASFPKSTHAGWKTAPMNIDPLQAMQDVLASTAGYGHVTPVIWIDKELMALTPAEVPGIDAFRDGVKQRAGDLLVDSTRSESQLIAQLRQISQSHRVVVIKTPNTLPYSTIFIELLHGNWTPAQEAALRARLGG